jgi:hypothetical protein
MTAGYADVAADKVTTSSGASTTTRSRRIALCDRMVSSLGSPKYGPIKGRRLPGEISDDVRRRRMEPALFRIRSAAAPIDRQQQPDRHS